MASLFTTLAFIWGHPLNRRRKIAALFRFICWQIGSRLVRYPIIYPFINGSFLIVEPGMTGATGNYYCGLHEYNDMGFVLKVLRSSDVFIDVGANVGSYSILAASSGCRVLAFEPIESTYRRFCRNVHVNGYGDRIDATLAGVGAAAGSLNFSRNLDTTNHVQVTGMEVQDCVMVPVVALDALDLPDGPVLIKIDVEGFEPSVIEGARSLLANPRTYAVIMEINHSSQRYSKCQEELFSEMQRLNFAPYHFSPRASRLELLRSWNKRSGNTLFIKNLDFIRERLKSARVFEVNGERF